MVPSGRLSKFARPGSRPAAAPGTSAQRWHSRLLLHLAGALLEEGAHAFLGRLVALRDRGTSATRRTGRRSATGRRCAAAPAPPRSSTAARCRQSWRPARSPWRSPCRRPPRTATGRGARPPASSTRPVSIMSVMVAADQPRHARRTAAADEDAALAFRQAVAECSRRRGCGGARQLQPAADHRATAAPPPPARDRTGWRPSRRASCAVHDAATLRSVSSEIEPGAEMLARAAPAPPPLDLRRQRDERAVRLRDQRVVDGVALGRPVQPDVRDGAGELDRQQVERGERAGGGGRSSGSWWVSRIWFEVLTSSRHLPMG